MNTVGYLGMGIYPNCGFMGIWLWVSTHIIGYTHGSIPMGQLGVHNPGTIGTLVTIIPDDDIE